MFRHGQHLVALGALTAFLLAGTVNSAGLTVHGQSCACAHDACAHDDDAIPSQFTAAPVAPPRLPACPFCPCCPTGCCWCSVAKAPCLPVCPASLLRAAPEFGQRLAEMPPHLPPTHAARLIRPPRA